MCLLNTCISLTYSPGNHFHNLENNWSPVQQVDVYRLKSVELKMLAENIWEINVHY